MPATDAAPSFAEERDLLIGAAVEAGHAVMPLWRDCSLKVWSKEDDSPVSEADMRADQVLREAIISEGRGDYGWLSEESWDGGAHRPGRRTFIVDPIDGTRAFLKGEDSFTICLAVEQEGEIVASVIYAPAREEVFAAALGEGATLNGQPIEVSSCQGLEGCRMLGTKRMFGHPDWPERWPEMSIGYKNSTSYRLACIAAGRYDGTVALTPKPDWDAAPGALIAAEAGAQVSDHLGRPFRFDRRPPEQPGLVCAAPGLYPEIIERLSHLPEDLRSLSV
ncbi:inositol monophosphatase family protein [Parvularcula maris]|uniref:3'(2'),5'-bisphosphate nucleotidase CysQ n=1 Tax=Parvularcula maris TaxID=2965077 RepID=A0A9X2LAR4_9PROT|nr:3'(2'),5'-bisphosphate nucleotidase CysQ [Parvularcula maris]MCQ8186039.1 3'(2'),5'-bisphosphate nucleotidase CysQ [Parvularcula maris]